MTDAELAEFLGRLDEKLDNADRRADERHNTYIERFDRVEEKQDHTNGRVRGLEMFKARVITVGTLTALLAPVWVPHVTG
jgi:hypothetical protein